MKKLISVILICAMLCTLCACGNPCAKGHSYVASEEGCKCERCGEVIEHSLTPTEDGCLCEVCGELKAHTFVAEEEHCVCEVCGFATGEHEFESEPGKFVCANCGEEVSKRDFLCDYILKNGEEGLRMKSISHTISGKKYEITYMSANDVLSCSVTGVLTKSDGVVVTFMNVDEEAETYGKSNYTVIAAINSYMIITGSEPASEFKRGMELKNASVDGDYNKNAVSEKDILFVAADAYIEPCLDGAQAVLDHYDLDITLADLGFVNFK